MFLRSKHQSTKFQLKPKCGRLKINQGINESRKLYYTILNVCNSLPIIFQKGCGVEQIVSMMEDQQR